MSSGKGELLDVLTGLATSDASRRRNLEDAVDDLRALVFQGCELYPVHREAARREPRRAAARPAPGTRRRAQRLLPARARLRPARAGEGRHPLRRLEGCAAHGHVRQAARRDRRAASSRDVLPERVLGALEGDRAEGRRRWRLGPGRRSGRLRDRGSPRSDHRAPHARAPARRALRRERQGRRGEEGRHRRASGKRSIESPGRRPSPRPGRSG